MDNIALFLYINPSLLLIPWECMPTRSHRTGLMSHQQHPSLWVVTMCGEADAKASTLPVQFTLVCASKCTSVLWTDSVRTQVNLNYFLFIVHLDATVTSRNWSVGTSGTWPDDRWSCPPPVVVVYLSAPSLAVASPWVPWVTILRSGRHMASSRL